MSLIYLAVYVVLESDVASLQFFLHYFFNILPFFLLEILKNKSKI